MTNQTVWLIVAVVAVIILVLVVALVLSRREARPAFEPRALPDDEIAGRDARIEEIERMFVSQPRESVAAARLLVDEMLAKMGYPVRLTAAERARDLRPFNRAHAERYRTAGELKDDANTEEMRRALKGYLDTARDILAEARGRAGYAERPAVEERSAEDRRAAPGEGQSPAGERPPPSGERPASG